MREGAGWKGGKGLEQELTRGPEAQRAGVRAHKSGWHQFAWLGDFALLSSSLGILIAKADDWNPPGLRKAGRGGVGIEGARENE